MLPTAETQVEEAVRAFFRALADPDRTLLADHMVADGMIFVHNRMDPDNPRVDVVKVADHVERWKTRTGQYEETMAYDLILVDDDMAQVWGPYTFFADEEITHCGYNSLSMVRTDEGWKVANTSFSMVPPDMCREIGAPAAPQEPAE